MAKRKKKTSKSKKSPKPSTQKKKASKQSTALAKAPSSLRQRPGVRGGRGIRSVRGGRDFQGGTLASGRTLLIEADTNGEKIAILSPQGETELSIRLTPDGPVLLLRGVQLEIESANCLSVNCKEFAVNASDAVHIQAAGQMVLASGDDIRLKSAQDTHIDGDMVKINCGDRAGYHDDPNQPMELPPELPSSADLPPPTGELSQ